MCIAYFSSPQGLSLCPSGSYLNVSLSSVTAPLPGAQSPALSSLRTFRKASSWLAASSGWAAQP